VIGEEPAPGDGDRQSAGEEARLASAAPVAVPRPRPETWPPSVAAGSSRESPARGEARTAVAPVASAPWMVQLAAQRNRGDAERSLARISERYGAVLGERQPAIVRSDLGSRGVFYRVRVAAPSEADALALCERLRSAGADCFAGPN
jgi:cell division septation protein DedD